MKYIHTHTCVYSDVLGLSPFALDALALTQANYDQAGFIETQSIELIETHVSARKTKRRRESLSCHLKSGYCRLGVKQSAFTEQDRFTFEHPLMDLFRA